MDTTILLLVYNSDFVKERNITAHLPTTSQTNSTQPPEALE